jgi:hypothetical protein
MLSSAKPYGVQYKRGNRRAGLYIHWIQFRRIGTWNWKCGETVGWDELIQRFKVTFMFEHESPLLVVAL